MSPFATSSGLLFATDLMTQLEFCAAIGTVAGVFLFFQGFLMFRLKRLILNTPFSKVRSASMGLVEISGIAQGPHTIPAGISGDPCFLYRARAWKLNQDGKNRSWDLVADETQFVPFYLEDSTGRMLIDPRGADLDLPRNFWDELGSSFFSAAPTLPPGTMPFLTRYGLIAAGGVRLEEFCIRPDRPLFILGTLGRNALEKKWEPSPYLPALPEISDNPFAWALSLIPGITLSRSVVTMPNSFDIVSVKSTRAPLLTKPVVDSDISAPKRTVKPPQAAMPAASNWASVSMDEASWRQSPGGSHVPASSSQVAVAAPPAAAEPLLQSLAGLAHKNSSPQMNPDDFDLTTPVAIGKGTDGKPFTLSSHSQKEVVQSLEGKSVLFIFGGPILTLSCLYFLAEAFNLLK